MRDRSWLSVSQICSTGIPANLITAPSNFGYWSQTAKDARTISNWIPGSGRPTFVRLGQFEEVDPRISLIITLDACADQRALRFILITSVLLRHKLFKFHFHQAYHTVHQSKLEIARRGDIGVPAVLRNDPKSTHCRKHTKDKPACACSPCWGLQTLYEAQFRGSRPSMELADSWMVLYERTDDSTSLCDRSKSRNTYLCIIASVFQVWMLLSSDRTAQPRLLKKWFISAHSSRRVNLGMPSSLLAASTSASLMFLITTTGKLSPYANQPL